MTPNATKTEANKNVKVKGNTKFIVARSCFRFRQFQKFGEAAFYRKDSYITEMLKGQVTCDYNVNHFDEI